LTRYVRAVSARLVGNFCLPTPFVFQEVCMSKHEKKSSVRDCLFSRQDMKLRNIRFARGSAETISECDFRTEIAKAAEQGRQGLEPTGWPKAARPMVDVHEFLANI
jgi:hypothetical protein